MAFCVAPNMETWNEQQTNLTATNRTSALPAPQFSRFRFKQTNATPPAFHTTLAHPRHLACLADCSLRVRLNATSGRAGGGMR
jgi:hypothetical protein